MGPGLLEEYANRCIDGAEPEPGRRRPRQQHPHSVLFHMQPLYRVAALALVTAFLGSGAVLADDDDNAPFSSAPTLMPLCGDGRDSAPLLTGFCNANGYAVLTARLDEAIRAAAPKAPANVRPLLKRDQAFFNEMATMEARETFASDQNGLRRSFEDVLRNRIATLREVGDGFGRSGIGGKWTDAFGRVTVTPVDDDAYRFEADMSSIYGLDDDHQWSCRATALLRPGAGGWVAGTMLAEPGAVAQHPDTSLLKDANGKPSRPPTIKLRRQGDTLRVVVGIPDGSSYLLTLMPHCRSPDQLTGSFFASGKSEIAAAAEKMVSSFAKPAFIDCARPDTASDEEICSDPDLAENDQRLNRAWKALLPRLDDVTRRALIDDQRHWVGAQANQYQLSLHPGMSKLTADMHHTAGGRDGMDRLQRARIALLEGFDENRKGLSGTWFGFTAVLTVTVGGDGDLEAKGWKWEQGNWKGGCEYDMGGKVRGGTFRADDGGKNPDTLERDPATLIVNRRDDAFAKARKSAEGVDEMKCRRSMEASSTARLFPAKPSADIDVFSDRLY